MKRRTFLAWSLAALARRAAAADDYPRVVPDRPLVFPRDHGSHPEFRTEWWYVTATVTGRGGERYGVQVTFFRNRPRVAEGNPSAFAPVQLIFAHAALGDPRQRRLKHDQRAARVGFGLAGADVDATHAWIGDWSFAREAGRYVARIASRDFAFNLAFMPTGAALLNGRAGYSQKGRLPEHASYYYSEPQLAVGGTLTIDGRTIDVTGRAWLDHEWSSEYLAAEASGWDWTGINFDDGAALMAFRMRDKAGAQLWGGGTLREADGSVRTFAPDAIRFTPQRSWRSPRTGIAFPVAMTIGAGNREWMLEPWFDDFELDSRATTGAIYWEGAVRALQAGSEAGRGYLELTGYGSPLRL